MKLDDPSSQPFFYSPIQAEKVFGTLSSAGRRYLDTLSQRKTYNADEIVISAGEEPNEIYLLKNGVAESSSPVFVVGAGHIFGITELLSGNNFEMSLRTITTCDFDAIKRDDFLAFLHNEPDVCFRLAVAVSELYRKTISSIREQEI